MSTNPELDPGNARDELFGFARKGGALVAGVADATAFDEVPEGQRPTDLLPNASSVVVVGGSQPRAGDWLCPLPEHQETMGTTHRITDLGLKVARFIEDHFGYYALLVPPGVNTGNRPFLDLTLAAELAGCGSRSLAGPALHPELGFMYYSAVVTTLPLPADVPLDPPACPAPACLEMWRDDGTTPCLKVCPIDDGGCLGGSIDDGRVVERRYDSARCTSRVYTYWIPGFQKLLDAAVGESDPRKRKMILFSSAFTRTLWGMTYSNQSQAQCFECMRVCPVGLEHRTKR
jgi:hypothetical protein